MTSNVFSKFVPTSQGRSFYEDLRRREEDTEDRAGLLDEDEENFNHNFHDYDLDHAEGLGVEDSRTTLGAVTSPTARPRGRPGGRHHPEVRPMWAPHEDDGDNDVPASLLVELNEGDAVGAAGQPSRNKKGKQAAAIPGSSSARAQWETTQAQQRLHNDANFGPPQPEHGLPGSLFAGMVLGNAKKMAEWRWANVLNLDIYMKYVYDYYLGNGMWCIIVDRVLHLV